MAQQLRVWSPEFAAILAEDYGAVLADLGEFKESARLLGAADSARKRHGTPRSARQQTDLDGAFNTARSVLGSDGWLLEYQLGFNQAVEEALARADCSHSKDVATCT